MKIGFRSKFSAPGIRLSLVVVLTLVGSVPPLLVGFRQARLRAQSESSSADERLMSRTGNFIHGTRVFVETRFKVLEGLAERIGEFNSLSESELDSVLETYARRFGIRSLVVADPSGNVRAAYPKSKRGDPSNWNEARIRKVLLDHPAQGAELFQSQDPAGKPSSQIFAPIWSRKRRNPRGVLISDFQVSELLETVGPRLEKELQFLITDRSSQLLLESGNARPGRFSKASIFSLLNSTSGEKPTIHFILDDNSKAVRAGVSVLNLRGYHWAIAVVENRESIESVSHQLRMTTLKYSLLSFGISLLVALVLSRLISDSILELIQWMKNIEKGASDLVPDKKRGFQFSELAGAWKALESMEWRLFAQTTSLKGEVEERGTQLVDSYHALHEERERHAESMKLAALGEMAGGIAHEINNPLAIIVGKSSQLQTLVNSGSGTPQLIAETAKKIEAAGFRIGKIIKGLHLISRDGSNDPFEPFPINPVIEDTFELCRARFKEKGVELRSNLHASDGVRLEGRAVEISQVILNLLGNAFDAVVELPEKWVSVETAMASEGFLEIRVIDSGKGIPKDVIAKMFMPFFTTKEVGKGTGLGLSICKRIVDVHGGRLRVEEGFPHTCFLVTLPIPVAQG